MLIPPSAGGVENRETPDVTGSGQHMAEGNTEDDFLVYGSVEHSPSGQYRVLHRRRPKAHGGGTTWCSANHRKRPHAGPTAETRPTHQPMEDESNKWKRRKATEVLSDARHAEEEVKSQREQTEECWRIWKRQRLIPEDDIKCDKIMFASFLENDAEQHATEFAKWENHKELRPTPRYAEPAGVLTRA